MTSRRPSPRVTRPPSHPAPPPPGHLPPEIVAVLRRTAEETLTRHQRLPDGRCSFCSLAWIHTDATYPCPPVRIAYEFLQLTGEEP